VFSLLLRFTASVYTFVFDREHKGINRSRKSKKERDHKGINRNSK
jgi:hypothetical protein